MNPPVNLDYPVPIKQKNNALGSAFGTGGDRLRMVSTMGSGSAYEAGNADVTFLQLLNLDYHAPGGQDDKAAGGANGVDVTHPPLFNMDYYAHDEQENGAPGDAYVAEVTYLPPAKLDNNAADEQAGNVNRQPGVPNERDNAADDAGEQEGDDDGASDQEGLPRAVPVEELILAT